jgi:hypothetical protein
MDLNLVDSPWAYSAIVRAILSDSYLLYIFFRLHRSASVGPNSRWSRIASMIVKHEFVIDVHSVE